VSQASATAKLDATRKRNRELEQKIADIHVALSHIPAIWLSALAALVWEVENPTSVGDELAIMRDRSRPSRLRTNPAAVRELENIQGRLYREGERLLGGEMGGGGWMDQVIYNGGARNTKRIG
jgi:hypothetical protein